mmetsp:Transcript_28967/g.55477  ORF Transcript_28967/g.55477 Transcript_28967/m.55477 type:complete len:221 (+) Transcript_28967:990-1652(+)
MAEHMLLVPAVGADMRAHILDHADDRDVQLVEHVDPFAGVDQGHILRGRDDNRSIHGCLLRQRHLHVTRARRKVHDQHIQRAPLHLRHHLLQRAHQHRTTPDHRLILVRHQADGHHRDAVVAHRQDRLAVRRGRTTGHPEHSRLRWAVNVRIQKADAPPLLRQCAGDVGRYGGFAYAALARRNRQNAVNARDLLRAFGFGFFRHAKVRWRRFLGMAGQDD